MARVDSLRLLLAAELPSDVATIEALLSAITERTDELDAGSDVYVAAHSRIDALLVARERLAEV